MIAAAETGIHLLSNQGNRVVKPKIRNTFLISEKNIKVRTCYFDVEYIIQLIQECERIAVKQPSFRLPTNREVRLTHTLRMFATKGYACKMCGLTATCVLEYPSERPNFSRLKFTRPIGELSMMSIDSDHIIPKFEGGVGVMDNLQPLCRDCNQTKGCNLDIPKEAKYRISDVRVKLLRKYGRENSIFKSYDNDFFNKMVENNLDFNLGYIGEDEMHCYLESLRLRYDLEIDFNTLKAFYFPKR